MPSPTHKEIVNLNRHRDGMWVEAREVMPTIERLLYNPDSLPDAPPLDMQMDIWRAMAIFYLECKAREMEALEEVPE